MAPSFSCFVDESGNTGPNLTDRKQPVFVHACLFVPDEKLSETREIARALHRKFLPRSEELHVGILNSGDGRRQVAATLTKLQKLDVVPVITIMERRIVHAHYVVDTCFDYAWNDSVGKHFVTSAEAKQELAQKLADLAREEELEAFANAFRLRDPTSMNANIDVLADVLDRGGDAQSASSMRGAKEKMAEQCAAILEIDASTVAMNTLNASSFAVVLAMAERHARTEPEATGTIIHDESPQFAAYARIFDFGRQLTEDIPFDNGQRSVPIRRIETLTQGDSKADPLLQLADVFAGTYRRLTVRKDRLRDREFDPWLVYVVRSANRYTHAMVSRQLVEQVWTGPLERAGY